MKHLLQTSSCQWRWWVFAAALTFITLKITWAQIQQAWTDEEIIQNTVLRSSPDEIAPAPEIDLEALEWARFGITHPEELEALGETIKTPEEKAEDDWARLAILDPEAYVKARAAAGLAPPPPTAEEQLAQAAAVYGILHPYEAEAVAQESKGAAERRREDLIAQAILNPREFNERVNALKTPAQRDQEAQARRAILEPEAVNAESGIPQAGKTSH